MADRKCVATSTTTGKPCQKAPIKGGAVCTSHGGKAPKVAAAAAVRAEVQGWGLGDTTVDPGEILLRLVTQSAVRAELYAAEVERIANESGTLAKALTANSYSTTADGDTVKTGEYIRAMTRLEGEERDRCAAMATKAIAAGLAERQVRIAENLAVHVVQMARAVAARLGHDPNGQLVAEAIRTELTVLTGGKAA